MVGIHKGAERVRSVPEPGTVAREKHPFMETPGLAQVTATCPGAQDLKALRHSQALW